MEFGHRWGAAQALARTYGDSASPGSAVMIEWCRRLARLKGENAARAFEPYSSTRGKDRGSGLSTVLGISRAHGALVAMRNDPGRGCEFTLHFPLDQEVVEA